MSGRRWTARQIESPLGNPAAWGVRFEIFSGDGTSIDSLFIGFALDPADAELMAAAPDLADALEALWRDIDTQLHGGRAEGYLQHVQNARAALAKAGRLP